VAAEKAQAFVKTSKTKEIRQRGLLRAKFKFKKQNKNTIQTVAPVEVPRIQTVAYVYSTVGAYVRY
jgi:hypothetical protein